MRKFTCLMVLSLGPLLRAQGSDPWSALRAKNPPEIEVAARLVDPHVYLAGQLIRIEVTLPTGPQWQFAGFLLDPADECGSVARPCLSPNPAMMNGDFSGLVDPARKEPSVIALNSYVPRLAQGRYRAAALARKMVVTQRAGYSTAGYADPPQYAVAPTVEFEVVAASAQWVSETIARCVATLKPAQPPSREAYQMVRDAALQLALLNDPAAWAASLDLLPTEARVLLGGLTAHPSPPLCELMQARVPAPAQFVSSSYLYSMSNVCARANLPPAPAAPATGHPAAILGARLSPLPPPTTMVAQPSPEMRAWIDRERAYTEDILQKGAAALAGSLPAKEPGPKWEAFATLLQRLNQVRANRPPRPDPVWIPGLTAEFVRSFPSIEPARKRYLLETFSSAIDSPELVPLLESILDGWKPGDYYEAPHAALRALNRVDPVRARARILAELSKPQTWLDEASLELLPAGDAPEMDDELIQAVTRPQGAGAWNPRLSMAALAKYATPRALARVKALYESQQQPCQPELMAYFVRLDPAYADRVFHSGPWDMHVMPPPCTVQYFLRTPPLAMGPPLEKFMSAYLMHSDVFVKTTAAQSLGRYGSAAALPALWDTLRYFHEYWKGKGAELAGNGQSVLLEVELRNAIARGRGWLATESDLRTIEALCSSVQCVGETRQDLSAWERPLRIELTDQPSGAASGKVAQYFGLNGLDAVEAKLVQFPHGAQFTVYASGKESSKMADALMKFAAEHGMAVTLP